MTAAAPQPSAGQLPRTVGRRHTDTAPHEGDAPGGRRAAAVTPHGHGAGGRDADDGHLGVDPRVGTTLGGRYLVERLCGEGAMGRVYEARHVDIGRRLAIKILHSSFRHSAEVVERFRREARAASKIGHPNIIDVTDSGTTPDGAFFFVMEFLDGVDLEQLIQREGALPVGRALLIAAQLTRALQAAHASEIIHRDLKPANVMLVNRKDDDDFVKVLDFGISRNMDLESSGDDVPGSARRGLTRPDVAVGTPVYMSPEQAAGMRADALTDVYAVGGLLYEMLTATPPCAGDDVLTVLNKKATEDPIDIGKLRPELPADVKTLVMRALSRRPKDRQPSMAALKDEVMRCLAASQSAPSPAGPDLRGAPSQDSRARRATERTRTVHARTWMVGAGVGGFVALMAIVSLVRRSGDAPEPSAATVAVAPPAVAAASAPPARAAETTPVIVPVEPPRAAPPLPPQEPVTLKRAARVVEPVTGTPVAPALAAPWPTVSPPVFPQEPGGGSPTRRSSRAERAAAEAAGKPAAGDATKSITTDATKGTTGDPTKPTPAVATSTPPGPLAPPTPESILVRGQTAFDHGNYPEAIRRAKEAMAAGAAVPGHLLVADSYYHLQRYADALREYEATLALEPSNPLARRGRELASKAAADSSR